MATIDHLKVSILDLSQEEGLKLIHEIRAKRRTPPAEPRKTKKRASGTRAPKNKNKKPVDLKPMVSGMTSEEKKKLAQQLLGG